MKRAENVIHARFAHLRPEVEGLWVEPVGTLVIARMRGHPTEELLRECQDRVMQVMRDTRFSNVLYDALELEAPSVDVVMSQRKLDERDADTPIRRAIVVPNSKLAYLARLAFGDGNYRVFYNDITDAVVWLNSQEPGQMIN